MKHEIRRIDAASAARLVGLVAGLLVLLSNLAMAGLVLLGLRNHPMLQAATSFSLVPTLLKAAGVGLFAYVGTAVGGLLYNGLAAHFGGLLIEVVDPATQRPSMPSSSTSKTSVASGGITGGAPRLP